MTSDIAVCPQCGRANLKLIKCISEWKRPYDFGYYFACCNCDAVTPTRANARDCDQDIRWKPAAEVKLP